MARKINSLPRLVTTKLFSSWPYYSLLILFLVVSYWDLILKINTHTFGHDLSMNWAYFAFIKESVQQYNQYPLWLPELFSGFPLNTSNLAALFYPPHLISLFLPLKLSLNLLTLMHIFLIGVSTFLLANKGLRLERGAAFIAALAAMLSPKLMNHNYLGHLNLIESVPWLIFALYYSIKGLEEKKLYYSFLAGLALALVIFVFSIFYIYALIAIGLYYIVSLVPPDLKSIKPNLFKLKFLAATILSSLVFGAVFLLPFIEFSSLSLRNRLTFWEGAFPAMFWDNLTQLIYPVAHRFHDSETLIYIGIPTLFLALAALITRLKDRRVLFLLILCLFTLTVALGANAVFYKIYYRLFPFFHFMRAPLRIWILFIIGGSLLAGFGADYLLKKFPKRRSLLLILVTPVLFISLFVYNQSYFRLVDYGQVNNLTNIFTEKKGRIYCLTNCLVTPDGLGKKLPFASGGEVVLLANYYDTMKLAGNYKFSGYSLSVPPYQIFSKDSIYFEKQNPDPKLLGAFNVHYLISPYPLENPKFKLIFEDSNHLVYENQEFLPRLFTVPQASPLKSLDELYQTDFKATVKVRGLDSEITHEGSFKEQTLTRESPNSIVAAIQLENDGFLVLNDTFYPGWEAKVDGQPAGILEANGAFRAIPVPAGEHEVIFSYSPMSLKIGLTISLLSLMAFGIYSWTIYQRRVRK
jgi:hypothetical protein